MTTAAQSHAFHAEEPRGQSRSVRAVAFGVTGTVHVVAVAVAAVAFSWQSTGIRDRRVVSPPVTFSLDHQEKHRDLPTSKPAAPAPATPALAPQGRPTPAANLAPAAPNLAESPALTGQSARSDDLSQVALTYRRAITEKLEAQARYPQVALRGGWQGGGTVLFRIERSGRLLDAAVAASTGRPALDDAALDIVRRAAPFPAIPDALPDELAITLPVDFLIAHAPPAATGP